jgi:hypothetical protein
MERFPRVEGIVPERLLSSVIVFKMSYKCQTWSEFQVMIKEIHGHNGCKDRHVVRNTNPLLLCRQWPQYLPKSRILKLVTSPRVAGISPVRLFESIVRCEILSSTSLKVRHAVSIGHRLENIKWITQFVIDQDTTSSKENTDVLNLHKIRTRKLVISQKFERIGPEKLFSSKRIQYKIHEC